MKIKSFLIFFVLLTMLLSACEYTRYMQGKRLYEAHCSNCHMFDGSGLKQLIPDISKSAYFTQESPNIFCLLRTGIPATRDDGLDMPAFKQLNNVEMTNLVNYIQHKWNPNFEELKIIDADQINCDTPD